MSNQLLWSIGLALVLLGFIVAFVAVLILVFSRSKSGKTDVKGGGAIIIGPVPIIFGTDKESVKIILILSIILFVLLIIFTAFSSGFFR